MDNTIDLALSHITDNAKTSTTSDIVKGIYDRHKRVGTITPKQGLWIWEHAPQSSNLIDSIIDATDGKATLPDQQSALNTLKSCQTGPRATETQTPFDRLYVLECVERIGQDIQSLKDYVSKY